MQKSVLYCAAVLVMVKTLYNLAKDKFDRYNLDITKMQ